VAGGWPWCAFVGEKQKWREYIEVMRIAPFSGLIHRLPSQCQVCHTWPANTVCDDCVGQFAQPHARCQTCALPVPQGMPHCGACLKQMPPLDQCLAAVAYAYPWSSLMADFKFRDQTGLTRVFASLLKATPWVEPALDAADLVLAMPLSRAKLRQRGYNQALLLARELSHTKVQTDILMRIQDTPAQHTLKRAQRLSALDHAFAVDPLRTAPLQGAQVVLVDDVMTTGASLYAAARVLRAAGASHITGLVFARTE
jgi:ComF family protein